MSSVSHSRSQAYAKTANNKLHDVLFYQYDGWLVTVILFLLGLGLTMVASSSVSIAERMFGDPLHYFWRQLIAVGIGIFMGIIILNIPMRFWQFASASLLLVGLFLLVIVLVPGLGKEVNGSMRWIKLGPVSFQASEPVRFCVIAYLAGYLVRQQQQVRNHFSGFIRPIVVLTAVGGLLLWEPDFGTTVILFATALGMLFLAGVPLSRFLFWVIAASGALVVLAVLSPYRLQRLTSFIDPWSDPYNTGFQLTQALIAFGRGDWMGTGLGSSVQKLFYLPEAHTDFIFSVLAEELGLIGVAVVIGLFVFIVIRAFVVAQIAEENEQHFSAYFAYGVGILFGLQAFINMGVNMGLLPTKGLTLPLMSYGGNSVIVSCTLLSVLLRIEYENRNLIRGQVPEAARSYVA